MIGRKSLVAVLTVLAVLAGAAVLTLPSFIEAPPSAGVVGVPATCNPGGSGSGTPADPYVVATRAQLEAIDDDPTCLGAAYIQNANISLAASAWTPLDGSFSGVYYGGCYAIDSLTIGTSGSPRVTSDGNGLFERTVGATVRNLSLTNVSVYGSSSDGDGALVGRAGSNSAFTEISVAGSVSGKYYAGLVIGDADDSVVTRVTSSGTVTATQATAGVGGVAGLGSTFDESYSSATVTGKGNGSGGLVGDIYVIGGSVVNSYATGAVSGTGDGIGGLVGRVSALGVALTTSYATGAPTAASGTPARGGLLGSATIPVTYNSSFWDSSTSGMSTTATDTGTTTSTGATATAGMQTAATFTGASPAPWSPTVWNLTNGAYPTLAWAANGIAGTCPQITSVSPSSAAAGATVTITGVGLTGATDVKFGGVAATSFTVNSETSITATVPAGTGTVDVSFKPVIAVGADSLAIPVSTKSAAFTYGSGGSGGSGSSGGSGGSGGSGSSGGSSSSSPSNSATPTPTPSVSATPTPAPTGDPLAAIAGGRNIAIPAAGLPEGVSVLLVNGTRTPVTVAPNAPSSGLVISGSSFTMELEGRGDRDDPLGLTAKQGLVLQSQSSLRSGDRTQATVQPVAVSKGTGFKPNSQVRFYMLPDKTIGTITTDRAGSYSASVPIPPGLAPGVHTVQVNGYATDGAVRSLSLGVVVQQPARAAKTSTVRVFFTPMSAELTGASKARLRALVKRTGKSLVSASVVGYVQPTSITANDQSLSNRRARVVADFLRSLGVKGDFEVRGSGVATQNGATARRVNVSVTYTK